MDNRKYVGTPELELQVGANVGDTSIVLSNLVDIYGNVLTMSNFGTKGYARINPEGDNIAEDISFTGVTANPNNSYTLTGVSSVLSVDPYTESSGLARDHGSNSPVRISNTPAFYSNFLNKNNDETYVETLTFSSSNPPRLDSYASPTDDEQLASKKYVDDTAGGTPISINRIVVTGTAGEVVVAGNLVYLDETDNEWKLADASASATSDNIQLGIAQGSGTDGNPITGGVLLRGRDENQTGLTQGDRLYASDTAGDIANSAGTVEVEIGHAVNATSLDFDPKFASYTTKLQRDALVGTSGTPSTSNKYVTNDDTSVSATADKVVRANGSSKIAEGYLQMTDAQATALTDGSNVDSLHTHGEFQLVNGVKKALGAKTYFTGTLPFDDGTAIWTLSTYIFTLYGTFIKTGDLGGSTRSAITTQRFLPDTSNTTYDGLNFGDGKDCIVEFGIRTSNSGNKEMGWGLAAGTAPFNTYNDSTTSAVCFTVDTSGNLYAHTSNGASSTEIQITGITIDNFNTYRIELNDGVDAKFYVNGVLEATVSTTLPSSGAIKFGFGDNRSTPGSFVNLITEINYAVEK